MGAHVSEPTENDLELFGRAIELPDDDREAFVRRAAQDSGQIASVLNLLAVSAVDSFLDHTPADAFPSLVLPTTFSEIGFELIRELGRGGMGVVYLAEDVKLKRHVALKVMRADMALSRGAQERLDLEARATARLDHPNIVPVYQSGTLGEMMFLVSAYVEGQTLSEELGEREGEATRSPARHWRAADLVGRLARAIEYAHREGVIHRDIKPSNIIIDPHGDPHIVDFGIAKLMGEPGGITVTGEQIGSLSYMSPEQCGESGIEVDARSDVYSLGAVLYELLAGHRLRDVAEGRSTVEFQDSEAVFTQLRRCGAPRSLCFVCQKALSLDIEKRYVSAGAFAADLDAASRGEFQRAWLSVAPLRRVVRQNRVKTAVVAASVVAVISTILTAIALRDSPRYGTVSIGTADAAVVGREVHYRRIDPVTRIPSDRERLGVVPFTGKLTPGLYRFEVRAPSGAREFTRRVPADGGVQLKVDTRATPDTEDMVHFPATQVAIELPGDGAGREFRSVGLGAFYIDVHEVTNAAFRVFVLETGRPPAPLWPTPYDPSLDELPVVGVTHAEALAFAEWSGKRLPTDLEWRHAAGEMADNRYPWAPDEIESALAARGGGTSEIPRGADLDVQKHRPWYLSLCPPVGTSPFDMTQSGVMDMYGGAAEWTESSCVVPHTGERMQIVMGNDWADTRSYLKPLTSFRVAPSAARNPRYGFRCVVSDQ